MSAGFIALAVATNNFGAGGFLSSAGGGLTGAESKPRTTNRQFSGDEWTGERLELDFVPKHGEYTSLLSCYAVDKNGTKWKVSQNTFLQTDRC